MTKSILMVHGVGCGGEVWDRMRQDFEAKGWRVEAPTLFPELRTIEEPPKAISDLTLQDYVEAMSAMAARMSAETGEKPAVIGHSMGGMIAQKLAQRGDVSAAIFLTPAAPPDCQVRDLRIFVTFWSILKAGPKKLPEQGFKVGRFGFGWGVLNKVDKSRHDEIYAHARYDSGKVYRDLTDPGPIDEKEITIPTLTIGAEKDRATIIKSVRLVGEKYAKATVPGDYLEYPDNAHWIVDEPGTDKVTADILDWLSQKVPG